MESCHGLPTATWLWCMGQDFKILVVFGTQLTSKFRTPNFDHFEPHSHGRPTKLAWKAQAKLELQPYG